jgi:hypothetical protein
MMKPKKILKIAFGVFQLFRKMKNRTETDDSYLNKLLERYKNNPDIFHTGDKPVVKYARNIKPMRVKAETAEAFKAALEKGETENELLLRMLTKVKTTKAAASLSSTKDTIVNRAHAALERVSDGDIAAEVKKALTALGRAETKGQENGIKNAVSRLVVAVPKLEKM